MSNVDIRLLAAKSLRTAPGPRLDQSQSGTHNEPSLMTPDALARFATLVTEARKKAETRTAFARALGITRSTLRAWERGRQQPTDDHLERLAAVLGVPVAEVRGEPPVRPTDARLRELVDDDIEIAFRYHHAPAQAKLATYELHTAALPTATRERIGRLISLCIRHQDRLLNLIEPIAFHADAPHRATPSTVVPPVRLPHSKKR